MKLPILPALAVAAVGLATACGGGSSSSSSSPSAASTPASSGNAYGSQPSSAPSPSSSSTVSLKTGSGAPGTFLVDSSGRTLYLWAADTGTMSTCSGACAEDWPPLTSAGAQAWPPLTTTGTPKAGSGVKASLLGTTKRSDGTTEVTYGGHPLYYFSGDSGAGETNGQGNDGFGADWWVVAPSGKAIEDPSGS